MFFEKFKSFVQKQALLKPGANVLLAVSGGIDSMVMMHLFRRLNMNCSIAHCNFQLRGKESDEDELFVRKQAALNNFQLFVSKLETEEYALEHSLSIQMAARELRYSWFEKLADAHHFDHIAIGHNLDDSFETFFINLGRGSGIAGLSGIAPSSGKIIRPLLFAPRSGIEQYAMQNEIPHREDSSNASDKYLRNSIRHNILPLFRQTFPGFQDSFTQTLKNIGEAYLVYRQSIESQIKKVTNNKDGALYIDINTLKQLVAPKTLLFEIIRPFGFSPAIIEDIFHSSGSTPGKQFFSSTHKLIKDRDMFILSAYPADDNPLRFYIETTDSRILHPCNLSFEILERTVSYKIEPDAQLAQLDFEKLVFPMILRRWHPGDYFVPLGMKGMKKVSDFFIDIKLSLIEKENTWLLTSDNQIVWIIGRRIDDRFKLTGHTRKIYRIRHID